MGYRPARRGLSICPIRQYMVRNRPRRTTSIGHVQSPRTPSARRTSTTNSRCCPRPSALVSWDAERWTFTSTVQGYAEVGLSRVKTFQTFQDPFFAGDCLVKAPAPTTFNITFAPGVAGNPYSTPAQYNGVVADLGTQDAEITSDSLRFLTGVKYTFAGWDGDSAIGYSKNKVDRLSLNSLSLSRTAAAFGVSSSVQPPIPTSTSSTYNLDRWTTNSQAVRDSMRIDFHAQGRVGTVVCRHQAFDRIRQPSWRSDRRSGGPRVSQRKAEDPRIPLTWWGRSQLWQHRDRRQARQLCAVHRVRAAAYPPARSAGSGSLRPLQRFRFGHHPEIGLEVQSDA